MSIAKHVPNCITCCNLLSGCVSIVFLCNGMPAAAGLMVFAASVFDFFDGFAARLLKAQSPIGGELDSLSDVVSFGVAPSFIVYYYLCQLLDATVGFAFTAFLLAAFAALRLAKFNVDTRQSHSFIGLPTPAMAIFVASIPIALRPLSIDSIIYKIIFNPYFFFAVVAVFSFLMVSEIPFFSLKMKSLKFKDNILQYMAIIIGILAVVILGTTGLPLIMIIYIILSLCFYKGDCHEA